MPSTRKPIQFRLSQADEAQLALQLLEGETHNDAAKRLFLVALNSNVVKVSANGLSGGWLLGPGERRNTEPDADGYFYDENGERSRSY